MLLVAALLLQSSLLPVLNGQSMTGEVRGVIEINDNFILVSYLIDVNAPNGRLPSSINFTLPEGFQGEVLSIGFFGPLNESLTFQSRQSGYEVLLPLTVERFKLHLIMVLTRCFNVKGNNITATIPLLLSTPFNLTFVSIELRYPMGANVSWISMNVSDRFKVGGREAVRIELINVALGLGRTILTNYSYIPRYKEVSVPIIKRELLINPNGYAEVNEEVRVKSFQERGRLRSLTFTLPPQSRGVAVHDDFGYYKLEAELAGYQIKEGVEGVEVEVRPRFSIGYGEGATFTIRYHFPLERFNNTYVISLSPMIFQYPIENLVLTLNTPATTLNFNSFPPPALLSEAGGVKAVYAFNSAYAYLVRSLVVRFEHYPAPFQWGIPLGYLAAVVAIFIVISAVYVTRKPRAPSSLKPSTLDLVKAYETLLSIIFEVKELEEDFIKGLIKKAAYEEKLKLLIKERAKAEANVHRLMDEVKRFSSKHAALIEEIRLLEAELKSVEAAYKELGSMFKAREISRKTYEKLMGDHERKLLRLRSRIEALLDEVKELKE